MIVDTNETEQGLLKYADDMDNLDVPELNEDYSYDVRLERVPPIRVERKDFDDFVDSMTLGKLERQLSYVDLLVLEYSPMRHTPPTDERAKAYEGAKKKLAKLSVKNIGVAVSGGPEDTGRILKYLENEPNLQIVKNIIQVSEGSPKERILKSLPGIGDDKVENILNNDDLDIDWGAVVEALQVDEWSAVDGIAEGTIQNVQEALED